MILNHSVIMTCQTVGKTGKNQGGFIVTMTIEFRINQISIVHLYVIIDDVETAAETI